jgi:hypothetical protein
LPDEPKDARVAHLAAQDAFQGRVVNGGKKRNTAKLATERFDRLSFLRFSQRL